LERLWQQHSLIAQLTLKLSATMTADGHDSTILSMVATASDAISFLVAKASAA
jgi:hypothetical protein